MDPGGGDRFSPRSSSLHQCNGAPINYRFVQRWLWPRLAYCTMHCTRRRHVIGAERRELCGGERRYISLRESHCHSIFSNLFYLRRYRITPPARELYSHASISADWPWPTRDERTRCWHLPFSDRQMRARFFVGLLLLRLFLSLDARADKEIRAQGARTHASRALGFFGFNWDCLYAPRRVSRACCARDMLRITFGGLTNGWWSWKKKNKCGQS